MTMIPSAAPSMPKQPPKAYSYVRFSRPEQMRGDSLRRQTELSERYARENGLELDTAMTDLGVSAFRGKNATEGALSRFLLAVKDGRVKRGSYLLVESLDRLSRQKISTALKQFLAITEAGVIIVTLADGQKYQGDPDLTQLIISLSVMSRAHEESATKAKRLSAAWANKRANIATTKLTALCPGWLRLSPDRSRYDVIPERAKIVQRMFAEAVAGKGRRNIVNELNAAGVATWGRGKRKGYGWHDSYVAKILSNKAVLGEYRPHYMDNGVRKPTNEVHRDYFPAIIDEDLFSLAQAAVTKRKGKGGRVSITTKNLFTGLCFCGRCGGALYFDDKGKGGPSYLVCYNTTRGLSKCKPRRAKYEPIERLFIKFCVDYDFSGGQKTLKRQKETELVAVRQRLDDLTARRDNLAEAIATGGKIASLIPLLTKAEEEMESHRGAELLIKAEIERAEEAVVGTDFHKLAKSENNRFRLRAMIKERVERVIVEFGGWRGVDEDAYDPERSIDVHLRDGEWIIIYGEDHVHWIKGGRRSEYEGGRVPDWEDPDQIRENAKLPRPKARR